MQTFIESIRKELSALWDRCYFGNEQRQLFAPFFSDVFTEDTLSEHEHQVTTVKNFYEENKEMFKLVEKRESLWTKKIEFEVWPRLIFYLPFFIVSFESFDTFCGFFFSRINKICFAGIFFLNDYCHIRNTDFGVIAIHINHK